MILHGDCLLKLKEMDDNSVDSIVTDPPYGISFMNKHWDYQIPSVEVWKECLRVLKPGGHALIACGTRTQHRMAMNIEDAGFEIRDIITWLYGSGFPKSLDVSKAIDKAAGVGREVIGLGNRHGGGLDIKGGNYAASAGIPDQHGRGVLTAPSTIEAKQWQGWGTALKPACEFWTLCRKSLYEPTIVKNVLNYGTGGINIDASRVGTELLTYESRLTANANLNDDNWSKIDASVLSKSVQGRFPANLILDEEAAKLLGEPARFFYTAKASKSERNAGLEGQVKEKQGARPNSKDSTGKFPDHDHRPSGGNNHPTVKPIKLMQYLIRLITPPNGLVLDPFCGSGSTGVAAKQLGFEFIGIEREAEYVEISQKRIESVQNQLELISNIG